MSQLLSVLEAQERIVKVFTLKPMVEVDLTHAYHRVLAQPIQATQDLPPFPNSSMDGFAVRGEDLQHASKTHPVVLRVIQDIPAGTVPTMVNGSNEASRIMTGAMLPEGANSVVPKEETTLQENGNLVVISRPISSGQFIRLRGEDIKRGTTVLLPGKELMPQDIGLIASLGYSKVKVFSSPRVAIFSSGDELIEPGQPAGPGKIYNANQFILSGLMRDAGAEVISLDTARDNVEDISARLDEAIHRQSDLIISSAGVSVGEYDYIRQVVTDNGGLDFWRVNMRPGKPVAFGNYKGAPFIGLPGNPVSAFVGCLVFALPVIKKLSGADPFQRNIIQAQLISPVESDGRESYLRCLVGYHQGILSVRLTGHQGSGNLVALSQANALLILPSEVKSLPAGSMVAIWLLGDLADDI